MFQTFLKINKICKMTEMNYLVKNKRLSKTAIGDKSLLLLSFCCHCSLILLHSLFELRLNFLHLYFFYLNDFLYLLGISRQKIIFSRAIILCLFIRLLNEVTSSDFNENIFSIFHDSRYIQTTGQRYHDFFVLTILFQIN